MKNKKIDFVITWVDGSDSDWRRERLKYAESVKESQYRDWDLLRYWFRGVEKYAPWVNKIYFVTYGHLPKFLNIDHPKLEIVKHDDFIPKKYLPTFSSHPIELNLHRIKGLSEKFVYFNDNMYLCKTVYPSDFFNKEGLPRDAAIIAPIAPANYYTISGVMLNNISIINRHFDKKSVVKSNLSKWFNVRYKHLNILNFMFLPWDKFPGLYQQHLPTSFLKKSYQEVWKLEYNILDKTCSHRIRDTKTDVNQWLIKEWQNAKNLFEPRSISFGKYFMVDSVETAKVTSDNIRNQNNKVICINDHVDGQDPLIVDLIKTTIEEAFDSILGEKSAYEI